MADKECTSINELAQQMKLSPSTVSRALNNMPGVSKKRAREICMLADKLGYRPNPYHRKHSSCLALVFPESGAADGQFRRLQIYLAEKYAASLGKYLFITFIKSDCSELPPLLIDNRVDGVLLAGHPPVKAVEMIRNRSLPMVGVNDLASRLSCDCVIGNPVPGARELILKLLKTGHSSFGFIVTDKRYPTVERRFSALETSFEEQGLMLKPEHCIDNVPATLDGNAAAVKQILSQDNIPDVLIFTNDWGALGGMIEIYRHGLKIPEDISIAAFDNTANCEQMQPKLTSIDLHVQEVVETAIDCLGKLIADGNSHNKGGVAQIEISSSLVWRASCRNS